MKDNEPKKQDEKQDDRSSQDAALVEYWLGECERSGKQQPKGMWKKAEVRHNVDDTREHSYVDYESGQEVSVGDWPVVNDLRNHVEGSMSYLDQMRPSFSVLPTKAFTLDDNVQKQAECEQAYIDYVWTEQKMQPVESMKLHSALLRNIGVTLPCFDFKKWMPDLKYLPIEQCRFDPDCKGIWPNVSWFAYYEDISMQLLLSLHEDLTQEERASVQKKSNSSLSDEEQREASDEKKAKHSIVRLWHIFAQNDAAVRDGQDDPDKIKSFSDELQLNIPRRYMQAVSGLKRFLIDDPAWPFELDRKEIPATVLQFNPDDKSLYGFTDHSQMERTDSMSDRIMTYIEQDCHNAAIRKFFGPEGSVITEEMVREYMESAETSYIPGAVDESGKPKILPASVGQINAGMKDSYEMVHEEAMRSSGQSELLAENMSDLKEVTALGVKYHEAKLHQRVNRRLSGPRGYESSILEDAVKLLEIAHQKVPRLSLVSVKEMVEVPNTELGVMQEQEQETLKTLPWEEACQAIQNGGTLVKLGVDGIVGQELAQYWLTTDDKPMIYFKLSTNISVVPGSTRSITSTEKVAALTDFYVNALFPTLYQPMMMFDKAAKFLKYIAQLSGSVDKVEQFIPTEEEIQQSMQQQQQVQRQQVQQQMEMEQQKFQMQMEMEKTKLGMEQQKMQMEIESEQKKTEMELQGKAAEQQMNLVGKQNEMEMSAVQAEQNMETQSKMSDMKLKAAAQAAKQKKKEKPKNAPV
jgi:hypothetical protein